jgi:hypothetical protein
MRLNVVLRGPDAKAVIRIFSSNRPKNLKALRCMPRLIGKDLATEGENEGVFWGYSCEVL